LPMYDRDPAPGNTIEQRRLPDVWSSYNRDVHRRT
jgi:hypothetical protein